MNLRRIAVVGSISALVVVAGILLWNLAASNADPVIARVEGIDIRQSRADSRIAGIGSMHGDIESALGPDWRSIIFDSLVDDVILQIEGDHLGLTATEDDIAEGVKDTRDLVGEGDDWKTWLEELGIDEKELERRLGAQLVTNRVFDHITEGIEATEDEAKQYYDEHPEVFAGGDGVADYSEVQDLILDDLTAKKKDAAYREWLGTRRTEVDIEVVHDDWK